MLETKRLIAKNYAVGVNGDCHLARHMVEGTNRIPSYRDASGALQLQRMETVPAGVTLYMFCSGSDMVENQCQHNGQFTLAWPMTCSNPLSTELQRIQDKDCAYDAYAVGYRIEGQFLELYRACFDAKEARVLYAQSDLYYKTYFAKRPFVDFAMDQLYTPAEAVAYRKDNMFRSFQNIYGAGQSYLPNMQQLVINRGHLVASADFLFPDQMCSTFRYLNVVPQFRSINDGNWRRIEEWIRSQVSNKQAFRIKTGGIDTLTLKDQQGVERCAYLIGAKLPVPQWIYKVVRDSYGKGLYVFLSYNSNFEQQRPVVLSICKTVACPLSLADNPLDGFIFCCNAATFP
ncbi:CG14062, partial [Drosophila busckii]